MCSLIHGYIYVIVSLIIQHNTLNVQCINILFIKKQNVNTLESVERSFDVIRHSQHKMLQEIRYCLGYTLTHSLLQLKK